jgi:pimeloyl-ACP methyl ester carboxylesterase
MYYEIHGKGAPLILIHRGGSTIRTLFGRVLHSFANERQVIAIELQGHDLSKMYEKDTKRMFEFKDWKAEDIHSINAPALIIIGDEDVVRPEHVVEMYRLLPHARLSILPGIHGAYIGEVTTGMEQQNP